MYGEFEPDITSIINHEVQVVPYKLTKNTSNLLAEDSEILTEYACRDCNFQAGNFEYERANNHNNIPRKFSTKIAQSIITKIGDYALLGIVRSVGDDMRVNLSVTSKTYLFGGREYKPLT